MVSKPPRANRRVNGDVSVDLADFLRRLAEAVDWEGNKEELGRPGEYTSPEGAGGSADRFAVNYLFSEIMSKFDDQDKRSDERKTNLALQKFAEAERLCAESNTWFDRVHFYPERETPPDCDPDVWRALCLAKRKLESWLGPFSWDEAAAGFRFTAGASARMPRTRSTPAHKFSGELEITASAVPLAEAVLLHTPAWEPTNSSGEPFVVLDGNRVLCVPKSHKVHRIIAAEPSGNLYFQKGIGAALRRRLRGVGVDLRSQSQNRDWAVFGSVTDLVATIDLTMASDTVSKGLVEWAIPPDWVAAMSLCRSPKGTLPSGESVLYRKWSSMGNAYTFELETVIFMSIAHACCDVSGHDRRFTAAYGDDIICPSGAADLVMRTLRRAGFVPNERKTFAHGPFRESCGIHSYLGADVTPFYIRRQPTRLTDLFLLVNNLRRWVDRVRDVLPDEATQRVLNLCRYYRSYAPSCWRRPRIPDNYGDGAFIGTFDECLPTRPLGKWLWQEGYIVEVLTDSRKRITRVEEPGGLTLSGVARAMLMSPPSEDDPLDREGGGVLPNRAERWIRAEMLVTQFSRPTI